MSGGCLALAVVERRGSKENAALMGFADAGTAHGGGGAGDEAVEPLPRFLEGVGDRAGADVADVTGEAVDQFAADAGGFELHAGEFHDSRAGLMGDDELNII